jgi:plasmid maintenance system killer protein
MEVAFRKQQLRRCHEDSAKAIRRWGPEVARKFITRIRQLQAIADFRQACNLGAMRLHLLKDSKGGELSMALTRRWRLIVTKGESKDSVIIEEVSNHHDD